VRGGDMRIIERAVHLLGSFLAPARPAVPVQVVAVVVRRQFVRLVVEKTLAHSILLLAVAVLQMSPEHSVDELLNFGKLLLVGLPEFLHHKREPRTRPGFIAQSRDPDTTVLLDDLICFAVITDGRRSAMEWIVGVDQPLFRSEEATEIGDRLALRLDDIIVNRLNE